MSNQKIRVRFAPSPTGMMHLGNIRTALFNFLFARQKNGVFVLRVEDTDPQRNFDIGAKKIIENLNWLGLKYDEGPIVDGPVGPYFQSERGQFYQDALQKLKDSNAIYHCFCTEEELTKKRERQIALKVAPRYDRACLKLSASDIDAKLSENTSFVWRVKVNPEETISFADLSKGTMYFELKHFSDFPITRKDGSFTFMFANTVDDIAMKITHAMRGEDHLTNTVGQVVMYNALGTKTPMYWHMPILCNMDGKKLSKRDFGFSLYDLQDAGFLPQAIINYLAITGSSFEEEFMNLEQLVKTLNFEHLSSTSQIKYDPEKLRWLNHKWISSLAVEELSSLVKPYLISSYPDAANLDSLELNKLVEAIKTDLVTLKDAPELLKFYFETPNLKSNLDQLPSDWQQGLNLIQEALPVTSGEEFVKKIKTSAKEQSIPMKIIFPTLRYGLTGSTQGLAIPVLIATLGKDEGSNRLRKLSDL